MSNKSFKINIISENSFIFKDLQEILSSHYETDVQLTPYNFKNFSKIDKNSVNIISIINYKIMSEISFFNSKTSIFIINSNEIRDLLLKKKLVFILRPFKIDSLISKINFLKKKITNLNVIGEYNYSFLNSELYCESRNLTIKLTQMENNFLNFLVNGNKPLSKDEILSNVWGHQRKLETHVLETLVYRIRKKIERNPKNPRILLFKDNKYILKNII